MEDLLTAQQVQDILKVNRITVYRMLQDGRLRGVKIGQQWRFPAVQLKRWLPGEFFPASEPASPEGATFPVHCMQLIQNLYADIGRVGALTVDEHGLALTAASHLLPFCRLVLASPAGERACAACWQAACRGDGGEDWFTCHAGLQTMKTAIYHQGKVIGYLLTGQGYTQTPDPAVERERLRDVARRCDLAEGNLLEAARRIPFFDRSKRAQLQSWASKYTQTLEAILQERSGLVDRLQKIVEISTL